jgi:hypothetical protein
MPSKGVGGNGLRTITQQKKNEPLPLTHFPSELKNLRLVLETADDSQLCFDFGETNQSSSFVSSIIARNVAWKGRNWKTTL